jgi:DnaJ-class molecular chaperone
MVRDTTLYDRLEIPPNSSSSDIKKAYYKLSKVWHPDKNPNKEEANKKFQEIAEAYEVLSDDEKRKQYDGMGMDFMRNGGQPQVDPNDLFERFFGGMGSGFPFGNVNVREKNNENDNIVDRLVVNLEDIFNNATIKYNYNKKIYCKSCEGTGSTDKVKLKCNECNGRGQKVQVVRMGPMIQQMVSTCNRCSGSGEIIDKTKKCKDCDGRSFNVKEKSINITLQNGLKDGIQMQLSGKGHDLKDRKSDLILVINIRPHNVYKVVDDYNLLITMELDLVETFVGFNREIVYLDQNKYNIQFDSGDSIGNDDVKMVKNMGLKMMNGERGDLIIKFKVKKINLSKLSKEERQKIIEIFKHQLIIVDSKNILKLSDYVENKRHNHQQQQGNVQCNHQ